MNSLSLDLRPFTVYHGVGGIVAECEVAYHFVFAVKGGRTMNAGTQLWFSLFYSFLLFGPGFLPMG